MINTNDVREMIKAGLDKDIALQFIVKISDCHLDIANLVTDKGWIYAQEEYEDWRDLAHEISKQLTEKGG
jgi:hypothetical protein